MKKIVKMGIAVAAMSGIGYLAYKGVKRLIDKVELEANRDAECDCENCDQECCATSDCCECSEGCNCHKNDDKAEDVDSALNNENAVEEIVITDDTPVDKVDNNENI